MTSLSQITHWGLPGIDRVPVGMHACHFYSTREQLVAALVPYMVAGLQNNERCLWVAAPPLPAHEAVEALRAAWDGVDDAIQAGALRILDFDQWYASSGQLKGLDVVQLWLHEEERALAEGYDGLRITGNTSFLKPNDWPAFMEYEEALTARFKGRRIVTLCTYALTHCSDQQLSDVIHAHHCALERAGTIWQVLPTAGYELMEPGDESMGRDGVRDTVENASSTIAANNSYRCYFTGVDDRIQTYEQMECKDDGGAALKAQELLTGSKFASAEVWQGKRFVGKWSNIHAVSSAYAADTGNSI